MNVGEIGKSPLVRGRSSVAKRRPDTRPATISREPVSSPACLTLLPVLGFSGDAISCANTGSREGETCNDGRTPPGGPFHLSADSGLFRLGSGWSWIPSPRTGERKRGITYNDARYGSVDNNDN